MEEPLTLLEFAPPAPQHPTAYIDVPVTSITIADLRNELPFPTYHLHFAPNDYATRTDDRYGTWDAVIAEGKSYLEGAEIPTDIFIKRNRSAVRHWLRSPCAYAYQHPETTVEIHTAQRRYRIYRRGEYVNIGLPYHNFGGEKDWVTMPPFRTKILVNVD